MVEFAVDPNLHADFRLSVETVLGALCAAYPRVALAEVRLFERRGNRSLAHVEGDALLLNAAWFARPIALLEEAALLGRASVPFSVPLWHGGMPDTPLPDHLLTHEFGHLLASVTPGSGAFSKAGYTAALANPDAAASGYALVDAAEWWSETFAALRLGAPSPQVAEMQAFLAPSTRAQERQ